VSEAAAASAGRHGASKPLPQHPLAVSDPLESPGMAGAPGTRHLHALDA